VRESVDDVRWANLERLAATAGERGGVPKRAQTFIWVSFALISLAVLGAVFFILVFPSVDGSESEVLDLPVTVANVLIVAGTAVALGGMTWAIATGRIYSRWTTVRSALTAYEWRSVRRQFAGRDPINQEWLPVLRAIAYQERRATRGVLPILGGAILLLTGPLLVVVDPLSRASSILALTLIVAIVGYTAIMYRAMGRFLGAYGSN
jgi:hypothetical protein